MRLSVRAAAALPSVWEQFYMQASTVVRLHVQNALEQHDQTTLAYAVNRLKGSEWTLAQEALQATNKLLHAFLIKNPHKVKGRSRPKVKQFKRGNRQFKAKIRARTGNGSMDHHRHGSPCAGVGNVTMPSQIIVSTQEVVTHK